jgi:hypothetical protein
MSPTAEQLIRDYLNQISVAARTRLSSDDRRAFLARMRFSIERHCGAPGTADPAEVSRVLANLGDPRRLVDLELARLVRDRSEGGTATDRSGRAGPRLGSPRGSAQRRRGRGTPSPWLVSGTSLSSGSGLADGAARAPDKPSAAGAGDRPLTGEIKIQSRPITSRWKPGEPLQPKPKQPRQTRRLRVARGGKSDQNKAGESEAAGQEAAAQGPAAEGPAAQGPAAQGPAVQGQAGHGRAVLGPAGQKPAAGLSESGGSAVVGPVASPGREHGAAQPVTGTGANREPGEATGAAERSGERHAAGDRGTGVGGTGGQQPGERHAAGDRGTGVGGTGGQQPGERHAAGDRGTGVGGPGGQQPGERRSAGDAGEQGPGIGPGLNGVRVPGQRQGPGDVRRFGPGRTRKDADGPGPRREPGDLPGSGGAPGSGGPGSGGVPGAGGGQGPADDLIPGMRPQPDDPATAASAAGPRLTALVVGSRRGAVQMGRSALRVWRANPLEGTAVVLLILAGLTYPFPIWLLGFLLWAIGLLLALASKAWDTRDKWTGLAAPVAITVVGVLIALALGGTHDSARVYGHEVGSAGPPLLRTTVVLGAIYLAWRIRRGPRSSAVPPWNRPHRI